MDVTQSGTNILTRWYAGSSYMKETAAGVTKEYTYIGGDAYHAPVVAVTQGGTTNYFYLLRDYLGNITHQVNTSNTVVAEYNFDAWGRRRSADDWSYTMDANDLALFADRGFTSHEYLSWFNLYNMNGRLYDPLVGRFISPDPYVQAPGMTQSMNRYTYCMNNPLVYVDYNGYTWFTKLGDWLGKNGQTIVSTAVTIGVAIGVTAIIVASGGTLAPLAIAVIAGASGGLAGSLLNTAFAGGKGIDYLRNGAIGTLAGGASALVGGAVGKWAVKGLETFGINGIASPLLKSSLTGLVTGMAGGYGGGFAAGFIMSGGNLAEAHRAGMNSLVMGGALGLAAGTYTGYKQAKGKVDLWTGKRIYPSNDGALGEWNDRTLMPGEKIDRYGSLEGNYFSPEGTPLEMRSLHPFSNTETYNAFEVVKPFNVQSSTVAPFYNQLGLGIQYKSVLSLKMLLNDGYIRPIKY